MTCIPCRNAAEIGWWGPEHRGTHCRVCHRSWTGLTEAHCVKCHEHFASPSTADLHDPAGVCQKPRDAVRKDGLPVFAARQRRSGLVWVRWDDRENGRYA